MADTLTPEERSERMSRVRGRNNASTELRLVALLRRFRIRGWRRGAPLPGKPDLVFPREKVAVFVDGCFWHGCPEHYRRPKSNHEFWDGKVRGNIKRDEEVSQTLAARGWAVVRIWEHEVRAKSEEAAIAKITRHVTPKSQPESRTSRRESRVL